MPSPRPASYAIHITSPLTNEILPLLFRDAPRALVALDEVWESLTSHAELFQCWLVSPRGQLMEYRGTTA